MRLSIVLKPSWKLQIWIIIYSCLSHLGDLSILAFVGAQLSDHLIKLHILDLFDIEVQVALGVILLE